MSPASIKVSATAFKAKCLGLIEEMNRTGIPIVVTNRGKPVAEMYPARNEADVQKPFIGSMKEATYRFDDPFGPAIEPDEWDALR